MFQIHSLLQFSSRILGHLPHSTLSSSSSAEMRLTGKQPLVVDLIVPGSIVIVD